MTRRKILFISIPVFLLLCGIFGYLFISSEYFLNNFIKERLLQALQEQINDDYEVIIDKLGGNVLTGVEIKELSIKERQSDLPPILSTEKVVFKYHIFPLLRRNLLVSELVIESPILNAARNSDGDLNLTQMLQKTTSEAKSDSNRDFAFSVAHITLERGSILYSDSQQNIKLNLPDITFNLDGSLEEWDHTGNFSIGKGNVKINESEITIEQLENMKFAISMQSSKLSNRLMLKIGNSLINVNDFQGSWEKEHWRTEVELNIDTEDVQRFIQSNLELSGIVSMNLNLNGTESTMNGNILCKSDKIAINQIPSSGGNPSALFDRQIGLSNITVDTSINIEDEPTVIFNALQATIADGTLAGEGKITFDKSVKGNLFDRIQHYLRERIVYESNWTISDIQLPTLISSLVEVPEDMPKIDSGTVSGLGDFNANSEGYLHIDGELDLFDTSIIVRDKGQDKSFSLKDSSLDCEIVSDESKESIITANGNIDNTSLEISGSLGNIDVKLTDIDFGKLCKIFKSVPFSGFGNISATINKDGTAKGYVEIPNAFYGDLNSLLGRLTGNLRYVDRVLYFDDARLTKDSENGETNVTIKGNIELEGKLPSNFTINTNSLVLDNDYNRVFFQQEYPITGNITGELNLFGSLIEDLDGKGTFTVDSGNALGINLDTATFPLEIDDYSLTIPSFEINAQGQQVVLNAHVTNDGEFDFSLKNKKDNPIQLVKLALAADTPDFPLDGKMDINITSYLKKNENVVFQVDFHFTELSFETNPLGDAVLQGILIETNETTGEPDYFSFTGEAFEGTSSINGKIFITQDSPYQFTMHSEGIQVSPILRILDRRLEAITGTAVATTSVEGTITDLVEPSKKRLFPYDVNILIDRSKLQYNSVDFYNPKPIQLNLENDILTFQESSLIISGEQTSFIELSGSFDTKNEIIDITAHSEDETSLKPFGVAFNQPIDGKVSYELKAEGPLSEPNIELKWKLPTLIVNTNVGDVNIHYADGALKYQNGSVVIEPFSMELMDNKVLVKGDMTINKDEFTDSILAFDINSASFDIEKLYDLLKNSISPEMAKQLSLDNESSIFGTLGVSVLLEGNIGEPIVKILSHSKNNKPILFGRFADPIAIDELSAEIAISKQSFQIQDAVLQGKMGDGVFHITGESHHSTVNPDEMNFNLSMSVNRLDLQDFATLFLQNRTFQNALVSGSVKCSGTGIKPHQISVVGKIDELNFLFQNYKIKNKSSFDISLIRSKIDSLIPLKFTSPEIDTDVDIRMGGLLSKPILSIIWQGNISYLTNNGIDSPFQWIGSVDYNDNLIELSSKLGNNGDNLDLKGTIPFNLSILENDFLARFTEKPIDVSLFGDELPLNLIPGLDKIFTQADGRADISLELQGTISKPHLKGTVSIEAPNLEIIDFPQTLENVSIQFHAQKDFIQLTKFQFDIEDGSVFLQQNQRSKLTLDGITPKTLELYDLTLNKYPFTSLLQQKLPENLVNDIEGTISATLINISIPLYSFFEVSDKNPIPTLTDSITIESVTQNAVADLAIDNFSLGFTLLDQNYRFENPEAIPISLTSGEFKVRELKLENTFDSDTENKQNPLSFSSYGKWNIQSEILLNMKLSNYDLSSLNSLFSEINLDTYQLNGFISTDINITGTYADPEITVVFDGEMITLNNANIDEFTGELTYSSIDKEWSIPKSNPIRLSAGKNLLTCSGEVPYYLSFSNFKSEALNEPMEILIAMKMEEIGILSVIAPEIESANGVASISATLQGTPNSPRLNGTGDFNLVSLLLEDSPIYFNDTRGDFEFSETELTILAIDGQLNEGDFVAFGNIGTDWFNVQSIDLNVSMDNCIIAEPGQYEVNVSTDANDLRLTGNLDSDFQRNLILSGDLIIHSGKYEQNWENVRDWFSGATVSGVELTFGNTLLDNLQLDLGIDIPEDFHFLSSLGGTTDIEITCNGRITGLIQEPIFTGDVTILDGKISIVTQEFDIVEGSRITNQDDTAFNPQLDIILKIKNPIRGVLLEDGSTADLMVTATVTGVLENGDIDKARLSFQADPINSSSTAVFSDAFLLSLLLPGSSISRSFGGITFTISSGFDPNERHIIAEYPLPRNMSIKVEGDERGDFGVDIQLLERRF